MVDAGTQLLSYLIGLAVWATISTVMIILARRDLKLGLQKWLMRKMGKEPMVFRYHGPNKTVKELVISTKNLGDEVELRGKKFFFIKDKDGQTFFLDKEAIRMRDDGFTEISYNYNTIMAADLSESEARVMENKEKFLVDEKAFLEQNQKKGYGPVQPENLTKYTDPRRLNKFVEYVYLAAKADALKDTADAIKWIKFTFFAAAGAAIIGVLIWYNLDGKVLPMLQSIQSGVGSLADTFKNSVTGVLKP